MEASLISFEAVQQALAPLRMRQIERLAQLSGVPATTIYKIKRGETTNPGIETVRKFMPHLEEAVSESAEPPDPADRRSSLPPAPGTLPPPDPALWPLAQDRRELPPAAEVALGA